MMELNGSKYLTNEEMAVINAMRTGGKDEVIYRVLTDVDVVRIEFRLVCF